MRSCICLLVYFEGITFTPELLQKMYLSHENSGGTDKQPSKKYRVKNTTVMELLSLPRCYCKVTFLEQQMHLYMEFLQYQNQDHFPPTQDTGS